MMSLFTWSLGGSSTPAQTGASTNPNAALALGFGSNQAGLQPQTLFNPCKRHEAEKPPQNRCGYRGGCRN